MAKLQYQFGLPFEYEVSKDSVKNALKKEFIESFSLEENPQLENFISYLCDNFFWEFFIFWQDELQIQFHESAEHAYYMEEFQ